MATSYIKKFRLMIMGSPSFVSNVEPLVAFLDKTKQGHSVLTYFGEHAPNAATFGANEIAVAIKEQDRVPVQEPIKTSTFGSWKESGPAFAGGTLQPIIRFPDFKTGRNILLSMSGKSMTITDEGSLVGHVDFPSGTPMDAVLFHEFCHAYLIAIGLGAPLSSAEGPDDPTHKEYINGGGVPGNISENVEEQIVCGLLAGRGLALCENAYRVERKLPPRVSYSVPSVNIKEDTVLSEKIKAVEARPCLDELRQHALPPVREGWADLVRARAERVPEAGDRHVRQAGGGRLRARHRPPDAVRQHDQGLARLPLARRAGLVLRPAASGSRQIRSRRGRGRSKRARRS